MGTRRVCVYVSILQTNKHSHPFNKHRGIKLKSDISNLNQQNQENWPFKLFTEKFAVTWQHDNHKLVRSITLPWEFLNVNVASCLLICVLVFPHCRHWLLLKQQFFSTKTSGVTVKAVWGIYWRLLRHKNCRWLWKATIILQTQSSLCHVTTLHA